MSVPNYQQPPQLGAPAPGPVALAQVQPQLSPSAPSGMLVSYTAEPLAKRAAGLKQAMIKRIISLVFSVIITIVWWILFDPVVGSFLFWLLIGSVVYSAGLLGWAIAQLVWTRKTAAKVPLGPAFQIDTRGVVVSSNPLGERLSWPQVRVVKGRNKNFNPGPKLEFAWDAERVWQVPIVMLDAPPSQIDSALRAFSLGRFGLDLSSVDEIW